MSTPQEDMAARTRMLDRRGAMRDQRQAYKELHAVAALFLAGEASREALAEAVRRCQAYK